MIVVILSCHYSKCLPQAFLGVDPHKQPQRFYVFVQDTDPRELHLEVLHLTNTLY